MMQSIKFLTPNCQKLSGFLLMKNSSWCSCLERNSWTEKFCLLERKMFKFYKNDKITFEGILDFDLLNCSIISDLDNK